MEAAIEAGAEDVESGEEGHLIFTAFEDLSSVAEALERSLGDPRARRSCGGPRAARRCRATTSPP